MGGEPTTDLADKVNRGQKVEAIFSFDSTLEDDTIFTYNQFLNICRENGDSVSFKLFEGIIDEEQAHYNYFGNVDDHIKTLGQAYLARIAGTPSSTGGFSKGFTVGGGA